MWHRITSFVLQSYAATATTLNLRKPSWRSNGKPEPHKLCLRGQRLKFSQEILFFPAACPFTRWHPVCAFCWSMFCRGYIKRICQKEGLPFNVPTDYHRIGGENRVVCCRRMQRATTCRRWKIEYGELLGLHILFSVYELHCCLIVEMGVGVLVRSVCCIEGELCLLELQVVLSLAHWVWAVTTHCAAPIRLAWSWSQHLGRSQQPADRIGLNLMTAEVNMLTDIIKRFGNDCLTFCQNCIATAQHSIPRYQLTQLRQSQGSGSQNRD